jgi:hypothetical protein
VLSNWELWACAAEMRRRHGERAPLRASERIEELARAGDAEGVTAWREIERRLGLMATEPTRYLN